MRTIRTKVYQFSELSKEAQQKVIDHHSDINVNYDWWQYVYEDAAQIGLKITAFNIDGNGYCEGEFIINDTQVAEKIIFNHGEQCETYKTASAYLKDYKEIEEKLTEEDDDADAEKEELREEFLKSLLEDYRIMLSKEYDYLTSEEAIKETIEANEYEFTADGNRF